MSAEKHVSTDSLFVPVKIKVAPVHATKAYRRSRDAVPLILNVGSRWWLVVNFTPRPLFHRERNLLTNEYKLIGPRPSMDALG
jgi:hypothetical protein